MSLRVAVGAPFVSEGRDRLGEHEFVVALSLDRDWMSPDQAKRLIDVATGEGLLTREDGDLVATFDTEDVTVPEEFTPDESLFRERSAFETVLDALVADGVQRQDAVAAVNALQRDLGVTADVAAVLHARREGLTVDDAAAKAAEGL